MPVRNKIEDLRNHLFETLEALKDSDKPMEVGRAKAIADVARVIVDSAKVEVQMVTALGATKGTGFMPGVEEEPLPKTLKVGRPS